MEFDPKGSENTRLEVRVLNANQASGSCQEGQRQKKAWEKELAAAGVLAGAGGSPWAAKGFGGGCKRAAGAGEPWVEAEPSWAVWDAEPSRAVVEAEPSWAVVGAKPARDLCVGGGGFFWVGTGRNL